MSGSGPPPPISRRPLPGSTAFGAANSELAGRPPSRHAPPGSRIDRTVEYALLRRSVLRAFNGGRLGRTDVCDAHPELLRVARLYGDALDAGCPICAHPELRTVAYVFGTQLKSPGGRAITGADELAKLMRSHDELTCYEVEICVECGWNHLRRRFVVGRRHAG